MGSSYEDSRGWCTTVKRKRVGQRAGGGGVRNLNSVLPKAPVLREHRHLATAAKAVFSLLRSDLFTVPHLENKQLSPEKRNGASSRLAPPSCSLGLGNGPLNLQDSSNTGCAVPSPGTDQTLLPAHPRQDQPALDPRAAHHGLSQDYTVQAAFLPPVPHPVEDNSCATAMMAQHAQPKSSYAPSGARSLLQMEKSKVNPVPERSPRFSRLMRWLETTW